MNQNKYLEGFFFNYFYREQAALRTRNRTGKFGNGKRGTKEQIAVF